MSRLVCGDVGVKWGRTKTEKQKPEGVRGRGVLQIGGFCLLMLSSAIRVHGQDEKLGIIIYKDALGFAKPVPINISGFSSDAENVLKNDLLFMGFANTNVDQADF